MLNRQIRLIGNIINLILWVVVTTIAIVNLFINWNHTTPWQLNAVQACLIFTDATILVFMRRFWYAAYAIGTAMVWFIPLLIIAFKQW